MEETVKESKPKAAKKAEQPEGDQLPIFKLHKLKVDFVQIPYLKDNKVEWRKVTASKFDREAQETLFAYWAKRKEEDDKFDIAAKKLKLFESE